MSHALLIIALLLPGAAQDKKDRVILKRGAAIEGTVQKESWKEISLSGAAGAQAFKAEEVLRIEYHDAPAAWKGAMTSIEAENWSEALASIGRAEEEAKSTERGAVKPRGWFPPALAYYRGLCLLRAGQSDNALALRTNHKDSRFLVPAYELTLLAFREKGDAAAIDAFEPEIDAAPAEVKTDLRLRAKRQRAELLIDKDQVDEAQKLFEELSRASDPETSAEGTAGVIKCLSRKKDAAALEGICRRVLSTAGQPALLLVASNALGDVLFDRKEFAKARPYYVDSVVKHNPGRTGGGAEREHERALYHLARCHEEMMNGATDAGAKGAYQRMASSAYRELSIEYPSGRYRDEAASKAEKYQAAEEKK
jgi:hypothetical protein